MIIEKIPQIQEKAIVYEIYDIVNQYVHTDNLEPSKIYQDLLNLYITDYNTFIKIEKHLQTVFK